MSRRCLFWAITAAVVIWTEIFAFLLNNAALMILGLFAGLLWAWAGGVGQYFLDPEDEPYIYERDNERLPR